MILMMFIVASRDLNGSITYCFRNLLIRNQEEARDIFERYFGEFSIGLNLEEDLRVHDYLLAHLSLGEQFSLLHELVASLWQAGFPVAFWP